MHFYKRLEVAKLVGISYPTLNQWSWQGIVPRPKSGIYTDEDVEKIKAVKEQRRKKGSRFKEQ